MPHTRTRLTVYLKYVREYSWGFAYQVYGDPLEARENKDRELRSQTPYEVYGEATGSSREYLTQTKKRQTKSSSLCRRKTPEQGPAQTPVRRSKGGATMLTDTTMIDGLFKGRTSDLSTLSRGTLLF